MLSRLARQYYMERWLMENAKAKAVVVNETVLLLASVKVAKAKVKSSGLQKKAHKIAPGIFSLPLESKLAKLKEDLAHRKKVTSELHHVRLTKLDQACSTKRATDRHYHKAVGALESDLNQREVKAVELIAAKAAKSVPPKNQTPDISAQVAPAKELAPTSPPKAGCEEAEPKPTSHCSAQITWAELAAADAAPAEMAAVKTAPAEKTAPTSPSNVVREVTRLIWVPVKSSKSRKSKKEPKRRRQRKLSQDCSEKTPEKEIQVETAGVCKTYVETAKAVEAVALKGTSSTSALASKPKNLVPLPGQTDQELVVIAIPAAQPFHQPKVREQSHLQEFKPVMLPTPSSASTARGSLAAVPSPSEGSTSIPDGIVKIPIVAINPVLKVIGLVPPAESSSSTSQHDPKTSIRAQERPSAVPFVHNQNIAQITHVPHVLPLGANPASAFGQRSPPKILCQLPGISIDDLYGRLLCFRQNAEASPIHLPIALKRASDAGNGSSAGSKTAEKALEALKLDLLDAKSNMEIDSLQKTSSLNQTSAVTLAEHQNPPRYSSKRALRERPVLKVSAAANTEKAGSRSKTLDQHEGSRERARLRLREVRDRESDHEGQAIGQGAVGGNGIRKRKWGTTAVEVFDHIPDGRQVGAIRLRQIHHQAHQKPLNAHVGVPNNQQALQEQREQQLIVAEPEPRHTNETLAPFAGENWVLEAPAAEVRADLLPPEVNHDIRTEQLVAPVLGAEIPTDQPRQVPSLSNEDLDKLLSCCRQNAEALNTKFKWESLDGDSSPAAMGVGEGSSTGRPEKRPNAKEDPGDDLPDYESDEEAEVLQKILIEVQRSEILTYGDGDDGEDASRRRLAKIRVHTKINLERNGRGRKIDNVKDAPARESSRERMRIRVREEMNREREREGESESDGEGEGEGNGRKRKRGGREAAIDMQEQFQAPRRICPLRQQKAQDFILAHIRAPLPSEVQLQQQRMMQHAPGIANAAEAQQNRVPQELTVLRQQKWDEMVPVRPQAPEVLRQPQLGQLQPPVFAVVQAHQRAHPSATVQVPEQGGSKKRYLSGDDLIVTSKGMEPIQSSEQMFSGGTGQMVSVKPSSSGSRAGPSTFAVPHASRPSSKPRPSTPIPETGLGLYGRGPVFAMPVPVKPASKLASTPMPGAGVGSSSGCAFVMPQAPKRPSTPIAGSEEGSSSRGSAFIVPQAVRPARGARSSTPISRSGEGLSKNPPTFAIPQAIKPAPERGPSRKRGLTKEYSAAIMTGVMKIQNVRNAAAARRRARGGIQRAIQERPSSGVFQVDKSVKPADAPSASACVRGIPTSQRHQAPSISNEDLDALLRSCRQDADKIMMLPHVKKMDMGSSAAGMDIGMGSSTGQLAAREQAKEDAGDDLPDYESDEEALQKTLIEVQRSEMSLNHEDNSRINSQINFDSIDRGRQVEHITETLERERSREFTRMRIRGERERERELEMERESGSDGDGEGNGRKRKRGGRKAGVEMQQNQALRRVCPIRRKRAQDFILAHIQAPLPSEVELQQLQQLQQPVMLQGPGIAHATGAQKQSQMQAPPQVASAVGAHVLCEEDLLLQQFQQLAVVAPHLPQQSQQLRVAKLQEAPKEAQQQRPRRQRAVGITVATMAALRHQPSRLFRRRVITAPLISLWRLVWKKSDRRSSSSWKLRTQRDGKGRSKATKKSGEGWKWVLRSRDNRSLKTLFGM
ncbi:hypothetical protein HDU97_000450 [Phlyctochytrium planicorne]|nr:hypothetical protein HDU97_000450 [Phlyctochytrium planicorne]